MTKTPRLAKEQPVTSPLTPEQLDEIATRAAGLYEYATGLDDAWQDEADQLTGTDVPALVDEVRRLREELDETKALHNPLLRGLLVKAAPDKDLYVNWSTVCDMPGGVFSRETALEHGYPRSFLDRADATGTSARHGDGAWGDSGFVAEQRGWLRRDRIGEYAVEYLTGDREAAFALLEPFDDDEPAPVSA